MRPANSGWRSVRVAAFALSWAKLQCGAPLALQNVGDKGHRHVYPSSGNLG